MKPNSLRAGASLTDITPEIGTDLAGYMTHRPATWVLDPLHARAVVIEGGGPPESGGTRLVFVLLDLIALTEQDVDPLREEIGELVGVAPDHICICCTHTHTAPVTKDGFELLRDAAYLAWAKPRIVAAVAQALERLEPARVAWGNGHEPRPQYNRRFHMRDGSVKMNPGAGNPHTIRPAGPTDPDVPMLLIESLAGQPIAVIANYSLHYIGDFDKNAISADYFGHFANIMRQRKGDNFVALLTHGASGDINNINAMKLPTPWYPAEMKPTEKSQIIAGMIADQVDGVWQGAQWHDRVIVAATENAHMTGVRKITEDALQQAEREWADESLPMPERLRAREWLELSNWPDEIPKVVQSLRVGGWAASTMVGEMFCQFGLDLKHASPFATTAFIELANGYGGYIANRFNYVLGGYEVGHSRSKFAAIGTGEEMVALAAAQLRALWKLNEENSPAA
jgi:hypothetical protein